MTAPKRVQRRRTRGWTTPVDEQGRKPVYVGRGSKWGNPFRVYRCACCDHWDVDDDNGVTYHIDHAAARGETQPAGVILDPTPTPPDEVQLREATAHAVELFQQDIELGTATFTIAQVRAELSGRDLMCWCPLDAECHADVLLALAAGGEGRG